MTLLDAVDRGKLSLNDNTVVRREDLSLFHQPLIAVVDGAGYRTTLRGLFSLGLLQCDNTGNYTLLRIGGGHDAIPVLTAQIVIRHLLVSRDIRLLQSRAGEMA